MCACQGAAAVGPLQHTADRCRQRLSRQAALLELALSAAPPEELLSDPEMQVPTAGSLDENRQIWERLGLGSSSSINIVAVLLKMFIFSEYIEVIKQWLLILRFRDT